MNPLREGTPVETLPSGLRVKREDLSCPAPGPPFSKMRGVWAFVCASPSPSFVALDTFHSQAGHAVAFACSLLGRSSTVVWPARKADGYCGPDTPARRDPQAQAQALGARLHALPAGRSCVLYHRAARLARETGAVMVPNGLQLSETIAETAAEVDRTDLGDADTVVIAASSGTIAAGVALGLSRRGRRRLLIHLGYSRPAGAFMATMAERVGGVALSRLDVELIDERYGYADTARPGPDPGWPCNAYYDLKAYRWAVGAGLDRSGVLFWNIG